MGLRVSEPLASVRVYDCPGVELAPAIRARLDDISGMSPVRRIVGLPDIHLKPRMEAPSSLAVETDGALSAQLSSPSPNCGMAMLGIGLAADDAEPLAGELVPLLRAVIPQKRSPYALSTADTLRAMQYGMHFSADRFDEFELSPERYDDDGRRKVPPADELRRLIPEGYIERARAEFGTLGGGNHFLELEKVSEVFDETAAAAYGLAVGQSAILYHSDSGGLGYRLGRLYAHRSKVRRRYLPRMFARKVTFHASRARSPRELVGRGKAFVIPQRFAWLPTGSTEAEDLMAAYAAGMNFAWANRAALASAAAAAVRVVFGPVPVRLVADSTHNSISWVNGSWLHRHNAARAIPAGHPEAKGELVSLGRPILLSGTDRSSTYVCRPGPRSSDALFSVDHGAGGTEGVLGRDLEEGPVTRRFRYSGEEEAVRHRSDDGIESVLAVLEGAGILSRVARTTPFAVLKE